MKYPSGFGCYAGKAVWAIHPDDPEWIVLIDWLIENYISFTIQETVAGWPPHNGTIYHTISTEAKNDSQEVLIKLRWS